MNTLGSEQRVLLADTLARLFEDHVGADGFDAALWRQVDEMALPLLVVPEARGGIGGGWDDALVVAHALGAAAVALPVVEAMLARSLAARFGIELPAGPVGLAPTTVGTLGPDGRFTGTLHGVPWGRHLEAVLAVVDSDVGGDGGARLVCLPCAAASSLREAHNPAGEPRDRIAFQAVPASSVQCESTLPRALVYDCALMRVGQIAGALETVLARSIAYAGERVQFGKKIGAFQAVQQQLAVFGSEVAAVGCAARAAFRSAALGEAHFEIAAAKLRANLAIDSGTAIAHQVHGAIGFTREHELRRFTQRLWSWRSEFGNDRHWSETLGQAVIARGVDAFWADLTQRGDAAAVATP